jgi:RND family efflux transporter MFP subunit
MKSSFRSPYIMTGIFLLMAGSLTACSEKSEKTPAAATNAVPNTAQQAVPAATQTPPVTITTVLAQKRVLPVLLKATGTVTPLSSVDVRSQVTSVVSKVHFKEGQFIKAGDLLFTLDARVDQANVSKAMAQLSKDNATLDDAQRQLTRSKELLAKNFISQGAVDTSKTLVDTQNALIAADRAAIDAAKVGLSFARIVAPSSGRVGLVNVFAGSTVVANQTSLVTITQIDPMTVSFNLPQRNLSDALATMKSGAGDVTATLPDKGSTYKGRLQFVDNLVDPSSGTVKVKAVFDNKEGKLWPGAFVDIALSIATLEEAVVIPQGAIIQSARGTLVYTIENGKAISKPVQVIYAQGEDAAVSGVNADEVIAVDGRQNLRPGSAVVERTKSASKSDVKGKTDAKVEPKSEAKP